LKIIRNMMRQIAGSFAAYEKARLVAKLRVARERKRMASRRGGAAFPISYAKPSGCAGRSPKHRGFFVTSKQG
jgi:hypothetical protein